MKEFVYGCGGFIGVLLMSFLIGFLFCLFWAYFAQLLWNYVMPLIFGLPTITFWQMLALMFLVRMVMPFSVTFNKNKD